ncbi:DNA glycosylase AlkZ-like family protein [Salipaludibacillus sp. CF4.18]|uniref:DNA glycosylase AlkZ-like family protein n=1 Tax=Salipaludibacillus sp. CF4.18 TaxID=3373081 RepID=UPI003EE6E0C9
MKKGLHVSKRTARQFLLQKLYLNSAESTHDFNQVFNQLECIQLDPVAIVERNHHLVLMNRLSDYQPQELESHLENKQAFEYIANAACIIPMKDYPLFESRRQHFQESWQNERHHSKETIDTILNQLHNNGPLPSKAFKSTSKVVGGWDHPEKATTKETTHVLGMLFHAGEIQVSRRKGAERFFALTKDSIPETYLQEAQETPIRVLNERLVHKYLRAYRFIEGTDPRFGWQKMKAAVRREKIESLVENDTLLPISFEGVKRPYFILANDEEALLKIENNTSQTLSSHVSFLPPLDNLLWRRERIEDLFDFTYRWEIYTPAVKRKYGPYSLPILVGDKLVGRADPILNRQEKTLQLTIHYEESCHNQVRADVRTASRSFGERLGAEVTNIYEL